MPENELQAQQFANWNGDMGKYWVEQQENLDRVLAPIGTAAINFAAPQHGERVLDIGCGCGATALILAEAVGADGHVTGLDISELMLARAKERSAGVPHIDWVLEDAASRTFAPNSFDLMFSRFGVMFFADPTAAFTNLHRGLRPGGRVAFACWRTFPENPWMHLPFQATLAHVPPPAKAGPDDPGPFAFADRDRVARILTAAGFATPNFTPLDVTIDIGNGQGLDAAVRQTTEFGPSRRLLLDQPESVRSAAAESIRTALEPHVVDGRVALPGAVWLVSTQ